MVGLDGLDTKFTIEVTYCLLREGLRIHRCRIGGNGPECFFHAG
jgi:hypothetical protein